MKCAYHNDREAEFTCQSCGRPICRECAAVSGGRTVCRACAYNLQYNYMRAQRGDGVNGFLFFIFLLVPGLRHMYIGFMKRGLQFLTVFFGLIAFAVLMDYSVGSEGVIIPLIMIVWFYSAFDSYNYRKLKAGGEKVEDKPLLDEHGFSGVKAFFLRHRAAAGVIIIVWGVYLLLKRVVQYSWSYNYLPSFIVKSIDFALGSIIPVLFIIGGIYLMTRVGRKQPVDD